jgi:hypothetical protein
LPIFSISSLELFNSFVEIISKSEDKIRQLESELFELKRSLKHVKKSEKNFQRDTGRDSITRLWGLSIGYTRERRVQEVASANDLRMDAVVDPRVRTGIQSGSTP